MAASRQGRGEPINRDRWPGPGAWRDWLEHCDRVHRANAMPSQRKVAAEMHLSQPSRVGQMLRGEALPTDEAQARALLGSLGAVGAEVDRGVRLYRKAGLSRHERSGGTVRHQVDDGDFYDVGPASTFTSAAAGVHVPISPIVASDGSLVSIESFSAGNDPPYISRDFDKALARRLVQAQRNRFGSVLLVGSSCTGKTRSCLEAIRSDAFAGWDVLVPHGTRAARTALSGTASLRRPTVIWLDEVQRFLGSDGDGLTDRDLIDCSHLDVPVLVIGTIWPQAYAAHALDAPLLSPSLRSRFLETVEHLIFVPEDFTDGERERGRALARDDQRLHEALNNTEFGVTQAVAGAGDIVRHWTVTMSEAARALTDAAIDLRRVGITRPATTSLLVKLARLRDQAIPEALADATRKLRGATSALIPCLNPDDSAEVRLQLSDYLLHHGVRIRAGVGICDAFWAILTNDIVDETERRSAARAAAERGRTHWAATLDPARGLRMRLGRKAGFASLDRRSAIDAARAALDRGGYSYPVWTSMLVSIPEAERDTAIDHLLWSGAASGSASAFEWLVARLVRSGSHDSAVSVTKDAIDRVSNADALESIADTFIDADRPKAVLPAYRDAQQRGNKHVFNGLARLYSAAGLNEDLTDLLRAGARTGQREAISWLVDDLLQRGRGEPDEQQELADFILYDKFGPFRYLATFVRNLSTEQIDDAVIALTAAAEARMLSRRDLTGFLLAHEREHDAQKVIDDLLNESETDAFLSGVEIIVRLDRIDEAIRLLQARSGEHGIPAIERCAALMAASDRLPDAVQYLTEHDALTQPEKVAAVARLLVETGECEQAIDLLLDKVSVWRADYSVTYDLVKHGYQDQTFELIMAGFGELERSASAPGTEERTEFISHALSLFAPKSDRQWPEPDEDAPAPDWHRYDTILRRAIGWLPWVNADDIADFLNAIDEQSALEILCMACAADDAEIAVAVLKSMQASGSTEAVTLARSFAGRSHPWILRPLADISEEAGDAVTAIELLELAVDCNDVGSAAHLRIAYSQLGLPLKSPTEDSDGEESVSEGAVPSPRHRPMSILDIPAGQLEFDWQMLVRLLVESERYDQAIAVIEAHPDIGTSMQVAVVLEEAGRRGAAIERLRNAVIAGETAAFNDFKRFFAELVDSEIAAQIEENGLNEDGAPAGPA